MIPSRYYLKEQISLRLHGGRPDAVSLPEDGTIYAAINQVAASVLKQQHFKETLASGETVPDNSALMTYTLDVEPYRNESISRAKLKAMPASMTRMQAFRALRPIDKKTGEVINEWVQFIPMPGDLFETTNDEGLINSVSGLVGYKHEGPYLVFTENVINNCNVEQVEVQQLGVDVHSLNDFQALPVSPDIAAAIIEQCVEMFGGRSGNTNPSTDIVEPVNKKI